jgi:twitching motility protein PilU
MEKSTLEGGQTFDQALFALYTEGRISEEQTLANADSANNLRIRIKNFDISGKTARQHRMAAALAGEDFRIEGVTPAPHLRRL